MLALDKVSVRYGRGANALLAIDGASLGVTRGQTIGLVGESGCGKSTMAKLILGLVPLAGGRIVLDGADVSSRSARNDRSFRRRVQMVFQDPYASLNPRMRVREVLDEALHIRGIADGPRRDTEATSLLGSVGLTRRALARFPHEFSGGQRQRIAIARALAVGPELIVHDEVTSSLDVSVQASILNLLRDLQAERGLTYVFISHDLSAIRYMSDEVAVMYLGRIVENAATDDLFRSPRHPYTQALIASVPQLGAPRPPVMALGELPDPRKAPTGCRFHPRCLIGPMTRPERVICTTSDPHAVSTEMPHHAACHFASGDPASPRELAHAGRPDGTSR
jgi:oligopeptide/dipeptide ABC transporter ATP-binding protein